MNEIITKTHLGIKTFDKSAVLLDIKPMEYTWWQKLLMAIVNALMFAVVFFVIYFLIRYPAQIINILPALLFFIILSRR